MLRRPLRIIKKMGPGGECLQRLNIQPLTGTLFIILFAAGLQNSLRNGLTANAAQRPGFALDANRPGETRQHRLAAVKA